MTARLTEDEMAAALRPFLDTRPDKAATYEELRTLFPEHTNLSAADRKKSATRPWPHDEAWVNTVRDLLAHDIDGFDWYPGGICLKADGEAKS